MCNAAPVARSARKYLPPFSSVAHESDLDHLGLVPPVLGSPRRLAAMPQAPPLLRTGVPTYLRLSRSRSGGAGEAPGWSTAGYRDFRL